MGKVGHPFDGLGIQKKRQKLQTLNSFSATLIISNLPCCHYLISNYIVHLVRKILSPFHDSIFGGGLISFIHQNIFSKFKDWKRLFRRKGKLKKLDFQAKKSEVASNLYSGSPGPTTREFNIKNHLQAKRRTNVLQHVKCHFKSA